MADSTSATAEVATVPDPTAIERAERFTRERFVHDGEDAAVALAPGSARRRALDAALSELDGGAKVPSTKWRRRYSLLLGLERLLDEDELLDEDQDEDDEEEEEPEAAAEESYEEYAPEDVDEDVAEGAAEDPNAHKRFWFEHATGAGKTVAAMGFVEASRTGGVLILTHRRNLVDQFLGELRTRGYADRESPPLLGSADRADGPVTVETYQWFVRNAGNVSDAYTIVICDEAHTALGEKTSAAIRRWEGPIFIGMTATGALIARHVTDLFPTQTSRFDLAQAARRGV